MFLEEKKENTTPVTLEPWRQLLQMWFGCMVIARAFTRTTSTAFAWLEPLEWRLA
jgi:putative exporter of polyketide antibiotics